MEGPTANGHSGWRVPDVIGSAVRVGDVRVGVVVDLIADGERLLGAEVLTLAERLVFLPWATAELTPAGVSIASALVLLDSPGPEWYAARGRRLAGDAAGQHLAIEASGTLTPPDESFSPEGPRVSGSMA